MVIVDKCADGTAARIQARGNFSLGASGLVVLLIALAAVTLGLAGILAWRGYWPILTIAVVQLALVIWTLVRAWQNAWIVEEILIDPERIRVWRRRYRHQREFHLEPAWAAVRVEAPRYPGYAPRLILSSGFRQVELGTHLTVDEKMTLAKYVSRAVREVNAWH